MKPFIPYFFWLALAAGASVMWDISIASAIQLCFAVLASAVACQLECLLADRKAKQKKK